MHSCLPKKPAIFYICIPVATLLFALALPTAAADIELLLEPAPTHCGKAAPAIGAVPPAAAQRLVGSQVVNGQRDIAWAWLGSPTARYPHAALGSPTHAGRLQEVVYPLPLNRVFEDLTVRLVDMDQDGRDEVIVIESDAVRGASVVVLGLEDASDAPSGKKLVEKARSPAAGSTYRWLNFVGVADFDGDGKLDVAAVITPHIGGVLTLYHYRPPQLVPYAKALDTSNHLMGSPEQQLSVVLQQPGKRPTIIVPDMSLKALHALRWEGTGVNGKFKELAELIPLNARVERITPLADAPGTACVLLADGTSQRVVLKDGL